MDVRKLRVLCELDARGTIAEVASALHMTPSAVSQQLAALGREVGAQLIEPDGRRVRLTGAGRVLVRHAQEILVQVERAWSGLAEFADGGRPHVRIAGHDGILGGLGLAAVLRLRDLRPDLSVSLHDVDPQAAVAMLLRGELDLAIGAESGFTSTVDDARFLATSVAVDRYELVLPSCHRLAYSSAIRLAELATDTWVFVNAGPCREVGLAACRAAGFTPALVHAMGDWATTLAAVRLGLGVALVPRLMLADLPAGVVVRTPAGEPLRHHVIAVLRRGAEEAPPVAVVLDVFDDIIGELADRSVA
jgi:DNA-binding transcriptional LysR family regulator